MVEIPVILSFWTPNLHALQPVVGTIASNYETVFEGCDVFCVAAILPVVDAELRGSSCHFCFCFRRVLPLGMIRP